MKLNLGRFSEARFGHNLGSKVNRVKMLMFGRDSEVDALSRF